LPSHPSEEALNYPTSLVASQTTTVLRLLLYPVRAMRRDHFNALGAQLRVKLVAVVLPITDQIVRLGFNRAEIKSQLHERQLMMIHRMSGDGEGQSVAVYNGNDFHALSVPCSRSEFARTARAARMTSFRPRSSALQ